MLEITSLAAATGLFSVVTPAGGGVVATCVVSFDMLMASFTEGPKVIRRLLHGGYLKLKLVVVRVT